MLLTIANSHFSTSKSPVLDFLRQSPMHMITTIIMIIANTAATATATYSHTCRGVVVPLGPVPVELSVAEVGGVGGLLVAEEVEGEVTSTVVTVGEGVGRGLVYRLGCDVTSVWVVDVISNMGVAVTEGEGSLVIATLAQLVSAWRNVQSDPGSFSCSRSKETLGMVCDVLPLILN